MLKSQTIQLKMSKIRQVLNGMLEIRVDDHDRTAERKRLDGELVGLETEYRAAIEAEGSATGAAFGEEHSQESAELRQMVGNASVSRIVGHVAQGRGIVDGVERELQSHFGLDSNAIPLRLLMPEHRVAASFGTDPATPGSSPGIAGQVFGDSAAAFANTRFEDVPVGSRSYPVIQTGSLGNVSTPAASGEVTETDAVLSVKELTPKRAQVQFAYTLEDAALFAGVDAGLVENIRAGLRDKIDERILNRGTDGLIKFGSAPNNPTAATTAAQYLAAVAAGVDGRHAMNEAGVRVLVGTGANGTYGHMAGLPIATGDGRTVTDKLGERVRVSPNIPAYGSDRQEGLVVKGSQANAVAAIWPGVEVIRDVFSREAFGEVRLVGVLLHDFAILRTSGYIRYRFRTS